MKEYVSTRVGLERVCLLVHTKRGMKPLDYELVDLMERCAFVGPFFQVSNTRSLFLFSSVLNNLCFRHGLDASTL